MGHAAFLRKCEAFATEVIVGINSDGFVKGYKGEAPVFSQRERIRLVGELGYKTMLNDGPGIELIRRVNPDVIAIGTDWAVRDYHAQIATPVHIFEELGISMLYIPYTYGISTTALKERLR